MAQWSGAAEAEVLPSTCGWRRWRRRSSSRWRLLHTPPVAGGGSIRRGRCRRPVIRRFLSCAGLSVVALGVIGIVAFATLEPVRTATTTLALVPELLGQGPQLLT